MKLEMVTLVRDGVCGVMWEMLYGSGNWIKILLIYQYFWISALARNTLIPAVFFFFFSFRGSQTWRYFSVWLKLLYILVRFFELPNQTRVSIVNIILTNHLIYNHTFVSSYLRINQRAERRPQAHHPTIPRPNDPMRIDMHRHIQTTETTLPHPARRWPKGHVRKTKRDEDCPLGS